MRTNIFLLFLFIALPGAVLAGEARIVSMSGDVEVRPTREGLWIPAKAEMEIAEGGALRTGAQGAAVLLMPNKTKVWFKGNSNLEIEQRQTMASRLMLVFGKIKVRVPHLMRKERFEVRTPAAVCAVRGTEFTLGANEEGKMELQVLFGEVKLRFMVPPQRGGAEFSVPQGQGLNSPEGGNAAKPVLLTAKLEREALENWNPGLKADERQKDLQQKENDREQLKNFARATNNAENSVKNFLNIVKESDLEAGRTLSDVHGNVVRVEQRMIRPDGNTIQFYNIVKRPTYANYTSNARGFAYNGGAVSDRLDYMQMTMAFNQDLPQRIEEWPGFFNSNSVDPSWASFVMANRTDAGEIFFIAQNSKYIPPSGINNDNGGLINNPSTIGVAVNSGNDRDVVITGILKNESGVTAVDGLNRISTLEVLDNGGGTLKYAGGSVAVNGGAGTNVVWALKTDKANSYSYPKDSPDNAPLAHYQADMYQVGGTGTTYLWLAREDYVIGNGGEIRTASDFTNSSSDPFTLLKSNALESVMYIKQSQGINATNPAAITNNTLAKNAISDNDYFAYGGGAAGIGTNIDVVFIPDLMVAAVQRMLPALTNLGN